MSAGVVRALRIVGPNDFRLVWRDGFLLMMILVLPLSGLLLRGLVPHLTEFLAPWVALGDYFPLILAFYLVGQQPILLGAVIGILFVEERDEGTLLALQASPLSLRTFLTVRIVAAMVLSVVLTWIGIALTGLGTAPTGVLLVSAAVASLACPVVALLYAVFVHNKVQAVTAVKPLQTWALVPLLLYFAPGAWPWLGSLIAPLYYPMRLYWSATPGSVEWWLVVPGVVWPGLAIAWLLRRLDRVLHA